MHHTTSSEELLIELAKAAQKATTVELQNAIARAINKIMTPPIVLSGDTSLEQINLTFRS